MLQLKPAVLYLDQINERLKELTYTQEICDYVGNPLMDGVVQISAAIDPDDISISIYKYAIVDNRSSEDVVIGYFAYRVNWLTRAVGAIFLISFYDDCPEVGLLIYKEMRKLIKKYHSVSWIAIDTCPALEVYKHFTRRQSNGYVYCYPQSIIDTDGQYHNKYEFYIFNYHIPEYPKSEKGSY